MGLSAKLLYHCKQIATMYCLMGSLNIVDVNVFAIQFSTISLFHVLFFLSALSSFFCDHNEIAYRALQHASATKCISLVQQSTRDIVFKSSFCCVAFSFLLSTFSLARCVHECIYVCVILEIWSKCSARWLQSSTSCGCNQFPWLLLLLSHVGISWF